MIITMVITMLSSSHHFGHQIFQQNSRAVPISEGDLNNKRGITIALYICEHASWIAVLSVWFLDKILYFSNRHERHMIILMNFCVCSVKIKKSAPQRIFEQKNRQFFPMFSHTVEPIYSRLQGSKKCCLLKRKSIITGVEK